MQREVFPGIAYKEFKNLILDMKEKNIDLQRFDVPFSKYKFDCVLSVSGNEPKLLIGLVERNWSCILVFDTSYRIKMEYSDYRALLNLLDFSYSSSGNTERFTSGKFLSQIARRAPKNCKIQVPNTKLMSFFYREYVPENQEPEKTVFLGWKTYAPGGKKARNFEKTELYHGKDVADYCRENNISSVWTTEDKENERCVDCFPPGYMKQSSGVV